MPVGGRLSQFVEGWKHITKDPYVLSIVTKGYRLPFTSPPLLLKIHGKYNLPRGPRKYMECKRNYPSCFSRMQKAQKCLRTLQDSIQTFSLYAKCQVIYLKQHSHFYISLLYAHYKLSAEYCKKRRLCVQNISAGCVLSCTNPSRQQQVPTFCLQKQGISVPNSLNNAPQVRTCLGHTVAAYLHHQGTSVIPNFEDWLIHHSDCQVLLCHQSQLLKNW